MTGGNMKRSMLGVLAAGAVASMLGSTALAEDKAAGATDAKACYRTGCGKSVKGHEGKCGGTKVDADARLLTLPVDGGSTSLMAALHELDRDGVAVQDVGLRRPTLDDVFLTLTGRGAEEEVGAA